MATPSRSGLPHHPPGGDGRRRGAHRALPHGGTHDGAVPAQAQPPAPANYKGTPDAPIDARDNIAALALFEDAPGILVELGNLKNPKDVALLTGQKNRDAAASALADGIQRVVTG